MIKGEVTIGTYKDIEIFINSETALYLFKTEDEGVEVEKTLDEIKLRIDSYIARKGIEPFYVQKKNSNKKIEITKLNKVGLFVVDGEPLRNWEESTYILYVEDNQRILNEISFENDRFSLIEKKHKEKISFLDRKLKIETLKDYRENNIKL